MKRTTFHLTLITFLLLCITSIGYAFFDSNADKVKKFMEARMYPQAIALLKTEISEEPANSEVHYQLGVCYINTGEYRSATERFESAAAMKPEYGLKIGKEYQKAGDYNLSKGTLKARLYDKAIQYDPSLKKSVASQLYKFGIDGAGDSDVILFKAVKYDGGLKDKVADHYYNLSQQASGEKSLALLKKASKYSGKFGSEIGIKVLEVCGSKNSPENRERCIINDSEYLDDEKIFDSSIEFYKKHKGTPKKITLNETGWVDIAQIKNGDRIFYLSQEDFIKKGVSKLSTYKASITKTGKHSYRGIKSPSGSFPLKFKKKDKNTVIYVWIESQ